jgi:serine/threonine protein phosphatase PrpC
VVDVVRKASSAKEAADTLVDRTVMRQGKDNVTALVIFLHWNVEFGS